MPVQTTYQSPLLKKTKHKAKQNKIWGTLILQTLTVYIDMNYTVIFCLNQYSVEISRIIVFNIKMFPYLPEMTNKSNGDE